MSLKLGNLRVASSAFKQSGRIPRNYAGDGDNLSPPLEWSGAPRTTKQFALICHDPDAPLPYGFTHWVLYGIPESVTLLAEGQKAEAFIPGTNDARRQGYIGPYPPSGHGVHHYYFWVYALGEALNLRPGLNRPQLLEAISGQILEQARLVGIYER